MLRKTNLGTINPLALSAAEKEYLAAFLQQHPNSNIFSKNKLYSFQYSRPGTNLNLSYEFRFSHDILVRKRKPTKNSCELRYEVLSNKDALGEGSDGVVLLSEGVLKQAYNAVLFKSHPRAVKRQDSNPSYRDQDHHLEVAKHEAEISAKLDHLHSKHLVITTLESRQTKQPASSYLVMRQFPGKNLQHFIFEESVGRIRITTTQRIKLSIEILRKVLQQSHSKGVIHRDIKPENIMLDIKHANEADEDVNRAMQDPEEVNLIDFSYAKDMNDPNCDPGVAGSPITMPPEQFMFCDDEYPLYSEAADGYSIGKTLAELWRAESEADIQSKDCRTQEQIYLSFFRFSQSDTNFDFTKFLDDDLSNEHAAKIKNILIELTRADPRKRWTLTQAIDELVLIQNERENPVPEKSQLGF